MKVYNKVKAFVIYSTEKNINYYTPPDYFTLPVSYKTSSIKRDWN